MIQTVIFDLGDVLVNVLYNRPFGRLKERFPSVSVDRVRDFAFNSEWTEKLDLGLVNGREFHKAFREFVGEVFSYDYFKKIWQEMFSPIRPMINLLPELKKNYRLVMLSNTDPLHIEYIEKAFGFFHYFEHLIFSYDVGMVKPDAGIFRFALEKAGCEAWEAVFVDDNLKNVETAREVGLIGIHFRGYEAFIDDWNKLIS